MPMWISQSTIQARRGFSKEALCKVFALKVGTRRKFCSSTPNLNRTVEIEQELREKVSLTPEADQYDVAIVGGGMVGLAFACGLSSMPLTKQLRVAIIDSNPALQSGATLKKSEIPDPRVSTVTPATISFFKEVGAWEYVQQQRHAFFDQMQVWDYTGLGYTRYNARDVGKECLGCVVENKVLCNSLLLSLQNADFQKTIHSARLISMSGLGTQASSNDTLSGTMPSDNTVERMRHGRLLKLDLSDGKSLYAKLVVGADGAKSRVREIAGVKTTARNYSQSAVICTVEHTVESHCAWQRFLPSGPIALLPIGDKFSNIVWTMKPEESLDRKSMSEDDFVKAVNKALDYDYGPHPQPSVIDQYLDTFSQFTGQRAASAPECFQVPPRVINVVSERMAFPLSLMHAHEYASRRVALIGDAAHAVHPLAGQGVNLGFGDASSLSKVIAEGLSVGADIGEVMIRIWVRNSPLRKFGFDGG
ncbi:ubiquinone biosynthesis monooxygenase COQ6, mitochondrial isoform X2 [Asparagus officinalis]|uniref:ubiquinone biosynthesis monooxygenase COQ6, mitochondrial isoform X2 n=1 Tax=Asparagus officinalis TaxID=4686 RepID=UPI00098E3A75|nr:ubiquinone biosynthesis monooxygenase COQ6, mitochondrial isoform X2 [Asparagus officinalis]